ncbi:hypothetical protein [Hymenobacter properus]|uniref:Uncharacterized protein n=1 Tax=Hymenobacter properus TaxID=2791026 RepID=A0A931FL38_9BACT|nr:hypothetical protein [Hymenobacter properus]MBF9143743.1 hypothetical protein [Hymenobacter properus]MBR7722556.1 hypothetical protein [Microvirga sp. SRT04]
MIELANIRTLFDELWPMMHGSQSHKQNCIRQFSQIKKSFEKWPDDFDKLLAGLDAVEGIGLAIASGLIWSVYQDEAVPFDKYTMTYALTEKILITNSISSGRYTSACEKVMEYCAGFNYTEEDGTERDYEIQDFVIESMEKMREYPALIEPR